MRIGKVWLVVLLLITIGAAAETVPTYESLCSGASLDNPDVCAWLEIPSVELLLPVMQHPEDSSFYLKHDCCGEESDGGALYTEATYSSRDFSDPVTVIYGRQMSDGTMFGSLQEWYSGSFEEHGLIRLYLPDAVRTYTVFAAVPYSSVHLLHYNDFQYAQAFSAFFEDVYSIRRLGVQLSEEHAPQAGDQVLILSTGLRGDSAQRYLVMAKLSEEQ